MALKVVLALAIVALAAADDGYNYDSPSTAFSHGAPVRAAPESSEEDDGYKYRAPVRVFKHRLVKPKKVVESSEEDGYNYDQPSTTFTHRAPVRVAAPKPKKTYVAPVRVAAPKPKKTYVAPARVVAAESSEEGYNYDQPAKTFVHRAPVRVAAPKPKKTYVAPVRVAAPKPKKTYVAPVRAVESSEEGYNYDQPAKTFSHRAPVRAAAPKPKNTYQAPAQPKNTYQAPAQPKNTYEAPANTKKESEYVLDYDPSAAEYKQAYVVADEETGADFHHEEERDGVQTRGSYSVALPDGRIQTVTYYVDGEKGFVAEVTYDGEAQYPPEPEGGYGPWEGPTAGPPINHVSREYSAPAPPPESSEEVQAPRGVYSAPVQTPRGLYSAPRA